MRGRMALFPHCWTPRQARGDGDGLGLSLKAAELLPTIRGRQKESRRHLHPGNATVFSDWPDILYIFATTL